MSQIRILYVGSLERGGTSLQRKNAIVRLGHSVEPIESVSNRAASLSTRIGAKIFDAADLTHANRRIVEAARRSRFDVIWIDKGLTISRSTLVTFRRLQPWCKIVGFSLDYMVASHNSSRKFRRHLQEYDIYFTTKSYAVSEMLELGARNVVFIDNSYDDEMHRPASFASDADRLVLGGAIGFIGTYEESRARSLNRLAEAGYHVRIWGAGWPHQGNHPNLRFEHRDLLESEYARGISSFDINLSFLRKLNRDLQTSRSIEIPACGGFMLAERTPEHAALFVEGEEASFFSTDAELIRKVRWFSENADARLAIAAAGRQRCVKSEYSYIERLKRLLSLTMK